MERKSQKQGQVSIDDIYIESATIKPKPKNKKAPPNEMVPRETTYWTMIKLTKSPEL